MARNRYDIDEVLEDHFDAGQLKRLAGYIKPYRKTMILTIVLMLSSSALMMLLPLFLSYVMDYSVPNQDVRSLFIFAGLTLVITIYAVFSLRVRIKLMQKMGQSIIHDLRRDLFTHLQKLPFSYYDDRPHGKIQVRVVNYINNLSDLLSNGIINTITDLCNLIFIFVFMMYLNVGFALIALAGLPVLTLIIMFIRKRQRRAWQIQSNKQSNLNAYIAESLDGIRVTQAFVRERENTGIFNRLSESYRTSWLEAIKYNFIMGPSVDIISFATMAIIYTLGVRWIHMGNDYITAGVLVAFSAYTWRFWQPINTLTGFYNSLLTAISYLERIFETIDEPVLVKDVEGATEMPPIKGEVTFDHVSFAYEENVWILKDINFTAKVGQSFAIVGPTGAGKTTIVNLISRFYPMNEGRVLVDGVDIAGVQLNSLRTQMGIMMQDSFIFSGTVMDNIRYGNLVATEEEVIRAAKAVCAHDFIMGMKDGYQTEVNERGSRLSQGQRQLISFARALLANPRILILDEATSSIDTETEMLLQRGLDELLKNRTSFLIAHRLSTIKRADCILYVANGKIMEQGNHDELMAKQGLYYQLHESQYAFLHEDNEDAYEEEALIIDDTMVTSPS